MKHATSNESFDTSDLTKRLLAMPQVLRVGIDHLRYDFRYDSQAKQIEVTYEFTCGIPHISGTIAAKNSKRGRSKAKNSASFIEKRCEKFSLGRATN